MKNLIKKIKRTNKTFRYFFYTVFLLYLVSFIFMARSLLLLSGIETFIRYLLLIVFLILFFIYTVGNLALLILKKHGFVILTSIVAIIFSTVNFFAYYYIDKTYNYIDTISKDKVLYTTNLISLSSKDKVHTVGMILEESDVEGHVLPKEYLTKNKNDYKIVNYEDYLSLLNDLYDEKIDGIFITSNYALIYNNIDRFNNIKAETKVHATYSKELKNQDLLQSSNKSVTEPFTVLIMGVDSQYDGLSQNAAFNGDALMLISFNPKTLSATVFSIPRDTYVPIACNNNRSNKINSAAAYGSKCMINTIENLTGLTIDYYVKINFKGLVALVDALGGIKVNVPEPDFPKEYCLEDSNRIDQNVCLTPGLQDLDGEKALALTRVRKAFLLGDFKRVQNQQLVIEAIVQKAKGIRNINDFYKVLNAISINLDTNLSTKEMLNFYNVAKSIFVKGNLGESDFINIQKTFLTGYDLTVFMGGMNTYTFQYYEESLAEIVKAMKITLEEEKPEIVKDFNFSINDSYEVEIIGKKFTSGKKQETVPNFVSKSSEFLDNWNSSRNLTIYKNYEESNICINNEILTQNVNSGTLLSSVSSLTVTVCKNIVVEETPATDNELDRNIGNILN